MPAAGFQPALPASEARATLALACGTRELRSRLEFGHFAVDVAHAPGVRHVRSQNIQTPDTRFSL